MIEEIKMYQAVCDRCGYVCDEDDGEIEIRDTPDEMKHEAENYGWEEVNGRLLCSKCLEECCDYNPQTYEFTEKTRSSDQVLPQF